MLNDATKSLKTAIENSDMVGIKFTSENRLVDSWRKRMDDASKMRQQQPKQPSALGNKRKNTIENMFQKIKNSK